MHIFHVLFSDVRGGMEQAYVDYTEALHAKNHRITALLHPNSPFAQEVKKFAGNVYTRDVQGFYDIFAVLYFRNILKKIRPELIIAHNSRAISLMHWAARGLDIPVVGVSHSYKTARAQKADALIVLTEHMRAHFASAGYNTQRMFVLQNMMRIPVIKPQPRKNQTPVIGVIARLVPEKGIAVFLQALSELQKTGVDFRAHIAGDGVLKSELQTLADSLDISQNITWLGWVEDKESFFRALDIAVVPSLYEPFGIVVLEAMAYGAALIASDVYGPKSIITHDADGLLFKAGDEKSLAVAMRQLLNDVQKRQALVEAGYSRLQDFGFEHVAQILDVTLCEIQDILMKGIQH